MVDSQVKLTLEQFQEAKTLYENGDRTGCYLKFFQYTGEAAYLKMAKISSFSGLLGGTAEMANKIASLHPDYPKEGVIQFSKEISERVFNAAQDAFNNGGRHLNNLEVFQVTKEVWIDKKAGDHWIEIGHLFPGNPLLAWEKVWDGKTNEVFQDKTGLAAGTGVTLAGFIGHVATLGLITGKNSLDFLGETKNYDARITPDFGIYYLTDKTTGKTVYVEETGAVKVGNVYIVEGLSEQQVAAKFNLPVERVVENQAESPDVRQSNIKTFTILTEANADQRTKAGGASKTNLADKEYGPPIPPKTKASESTESEVLGSSTGSFSTSDKGGTPLSWSVFNQWSWSNPFSQSYIPAGNIFTMYRPTFLNKPLFDFGNSFDNRLINEPSWLYTGKNSESDKYNKVKQEFREAVKECLGRSFCRDTTDTLMDKAIKMVYGWVDRPSSVFTSMDKWFEAQQSLLH